MGWFTKNKDKKKKEEEEKKKKALEKEQQANNKKNKEEQKQSDSQRRISSSSQIPQQQQEEEEQVNLIKEEDFIVSPVFRSPANQYIDDKCICFENTKDINSDHKKVHSEYKTLIDELVLGLAQDICVEPDKIMEICEVALNFRNQRKYFIYFQIYFHFDDFIKVMAKRNVDLEQEAFANLQKKNRGSQQLKENDYEQAIKNSLSNTQVNGDKELQKAILASQKEFEKKKNLQDEEDEQLQEVLRISKMESDKNKIQSVIKQDMNQANHQINKKISKPEQKKNDDDDDDLIDIQDSDDDEEDNLYYDYKQESKAQLGNKDQNFDQMLNQSRQNLQKNIENMKSNKSSSQNQIQEETLEQRKDRINKQRELLNEKKRMERANELEEYAEQQNQELLMLDDDDDDTQSQMEIKKKKDFVNKIQQGMQGNN